VRQSTEISTTGNLRREAERLTKKYLEAAARHFGAKLATPEIRFDLRGKTAGQLRTTDRRGFLIRYNAQLLERHPRQFLARTVPHETAHLVAISLFGSRILPHGREWQAVMAAFGAPAERCHSYATEGLQTRHLRRYAYRCACRTHQLTSIRHNRVRSGQVYLCRQCGQPLEPVLKPSAD
jgi:SprT protein